MNIVFYGLTWRKISSESRRLQHTLGQEAATIRASLQAAKTMSLFVTAFFAQWWAMALYGIWQMIAPVPQVLFQFVTTFSNVGGILNGVVYIIIRRRRASAKSKRTAAREKQFQDIKSISDKVENSSVWMFVRGFFSDFVELRIFSCDTYLVKDLDEDHDSEQINPTQPFYNFNNFSVHRLFIVFSHVTCSTYRPIWMQMLQEC